MFSIPKKRNPTSVTMFGITVGINTGAGTNGQLIHRSWGRTLGGLETFTVGLAGLTGDSGLTTTLRGRTTIARAIAGPGFHFDQFLSSLVIRMHTTSGTRDDITVFVEDTSSGWSATDQTRSFSSGRSTGWVVRQVSTVVAPSITRSIDSVFTIR